MCRIVAGIVFSIFVSILVIEILRPIVTLMLIDLVDTSDCEGQYENCLKGLTRDSISYERSNGESPCMTLFKSCDWMEVYKRYMRSYRNSVGYKWKEK